MLPNKENYLDFRLRSEKWASLFEWQAPMFGKSLLPIIQDRQFFYTEDWAGFSPATLVPMNQAICFHIPEHTVTAVHSPVRTWNIRRVHLHRLRFTAVEACQFVKQIHKVKLILCFQNLNILARSTRRETKGRMTVMTPAAPSVARSSQTLTSE